MRAASMHAARYQLDMPGLIIHPEDDRFVQVMESELIHHAWFDSRLMRLSEGGHQPVLADSRVVAAMVALVNGRHLQARQSA